MSIPFSLVTPSPGQLVRYHGEIMSFGLPMPDGRYTLTNLSTKETQNIWPTDWAQAYIDGYVEEHELFVTPGSVKKQKISRLDFTTASDEDKAVARRKAAYVQALYEFGVANYQASRYRQVIDQVAERLNDPNRPSHSTVQRWRRDWVQSEEDIRVFLPQVARRGPKRIRWSRELLLLAGEVAKRGLLTRDQHTVAKFHRSLAAAIQEANATREPQHQLPFPSESSVRRYVTQLDGYGVMGARKGRRATERAMRAYVRGVKTSRALERAEIDHTLLDVFVVDTEAGIVLGRPWLTIVIDVHTRAILAFCITFTPPSWLSVMEALRLAILPKGNLKLRFPELQHDWNCFGTPEVWVVDNGKEFHSASFSDAADAMGVVVQYCPPSEPWFKGVVERFMRSLNQGLVHTLPGSTFGKQFKLADYDPAKHATIDFRDLEKLLYLWIVDVYMQDFHTGIRGIPAVRWAEETAKVPPRLPQSRAQLDVILGEVMERNIHHYGIEIEGQLFNSQELVAVRTRCEGPSFGSKRKSVRVKIKRIPSVLTGIYVRDPGKDEYLWIPNVDQEYAKGKGWHQHRIIQDFAKAAGEGKIDREALRKAEARIDRHIQKSVQRPGAKRSHKNLARYQGIAQARLNAPDTVGPAEAGPPQASPSTVEAVVADESLITASLDAPLIPTLLPSTNVGWEVEVD